MIFEQVIKEKTTQNVCNIAEITAVAVDMNGKLIKKMPEKIVSAFQNALEK